MILARRNDREDVSPFLSVFYIALQYCLSVGVPVHVSSVPTVGPSGRKQITARTTTSSFPLQILGLNAEAKIRRKTQEIQMKEENLLTVQLCVLYRCTLEYTLSRLLSIMHLPKQYL